MKVENGVSLATAIRIRITIGIRIFDEKGG